MNRKDFVRKVAEVLQQNNIRKHVTAQKTVLHISDDEGHQSDFIMKKPSTGLLFTHKDISDILEACFAVTEDALRHGEEIVIHGFGSIGLKHRAGRQTKHPKTGELVDINARYVPKFSFGANLRLAAKLFELSQQENKAVD